MAEPLPIPPLWCSFDGLCMDTGELQSMTRKTLSACQIMPRLLPMSIQPSIQSKPSLTYMGQNDILVLLCTYCGSLARVTVPMKISSVRNSNRKYIVNVRWDLDRMKKLKAKTLYFRDSNQTCQALT
jgi:hypothetical protein